MEVKEIELKGHIIDSFILPKVFDTIMDMGGDFDVTEFTIGKKKTEPSYARILIKTQNRKQLDDIIGELIKVGATIPDIEEIELKAASRDKTLPDNFYSTTNHPTYIRLNKDWVKVDRQEMDLVIVVEKKSKTATCVPISDVRKGDFVVVGKKSPQNP
jgi:hypothetical protein